MLRHKATRRMASATLATLIGVAGLSLVGNDLAGAATTPAGVTDGPVAGVISNYTNASISGPTGITVGHDGALWFTNLNFSSVGRITTAGSVSSYANPSSSITWDITAGSDGALWFSNLGNNLIGRITTAGATTYYKDATIVGPFGITNGPDGALWIANNGNSTIGRITTAGVVTNYTDPTISSPDAITSGPNGDQDLWFTNLGNDSIGRITTSGVVTNYTSPTISSPEGITAGPDGALWFTNSGNNSIGRITTSGVITNYSNGTVSEPDGITTGPDGALWFTNSGNNSIGRITTSGVISNYSNSTVSGPVGIVTGPDQALWFTNYGNGSIGRITAGPLSGSQVITFTSTAPTDAAVGGPGYSVAATGGASGNPVTLSVDPSASSVCSISDAVVTFIGAGTCEIDANQAGNAGYLAAPQAQQRFIVRQPLPVITSADSATAVSGAAFSFTVTTSAATVPSLTKKGKLPRHLTFVNNGDGTATISGTPTVTGTYDVTIKARVGTGRTKAVATQAFTLTIGPG